MSNQLQARDGATGNASASTIAARLAGLSLLPRILRYSIAIKIVLLVALALNSRFVMDEFWQLGQAKFLFNGYFDTIWPGKAVGYAVFYEFAHSLGWNATSTMLIGRMQNVLLGIALLCVIYRLALQLGEDRVRALLVVLVLLSFSNFMERIFRTRADPLSVFLAASALLVVVQGPIDRPRRLFIAGILSGLSFLATQKAVYFNVALGLGLACDAAIARQYREAFTRGAFLVAGWLVAIAGYCFAFGGMNPLPILQNLIEGPVQVAVHGEEAYGSLRGYVVQSLVRNPVLYIACVGGMLVALRRFVTLLPTERITLAFSLIITVLVFLHNQPWPYVFIMSLPFMGLWSLRLWSPIAHHAAFRRPALVAFFASIAISFVTNITYLRLDNREQLDLLARAEALLRPGEQYFDGIGMLPNRRESTPLWLDAAHILDTRELEEKSAAFKGLSENPPSMLIWTYRMDAIHPVVTKVIDDRYARVSPNILIVGQRLENNREAIFDVPEQGRYRLYTTGGEPVDTTVEIDGHDYRPPIFLQRGRKSVMLRGNQSPLLILREGDYEGRFSPSPDNRQLFDGVYD